MTGATSAPSTTWPPSASRATRSTRAPTCTRSPACCSSASPREKPFTGDDLPALMYAHLYTPPRRVSAVNPAVGTELDAVIAKGMAKKPADRYPTPGALAAAARAAHRRWRATRPSTSRRSPGGSRRPSEPDTVAARPLVGAPARCGAAMAAGGITEPHRAALPRAAPRRPRAPRSGSRIEHPHPGRAAARAARPAAVRPRRAPPAPRRPRRGARLVGLLAVVALLVAGGAAGAIWFLSRGAAPRPSTDGGAHRGAPARRLGAARRSSPPARGADRPERRHADGRPDRARQLHARLHGDRPERPVRLHRQPRARAC